jgi:hypothetical protein
MTDIPMTAAAAAMAKQQLKSGTALTRLLFPFYLASFDSTTIVRFLPEKDKKNPLPWQAQHMVKLPFCGIVNSDHGTAHDVVVSVPCLTNWFKKDPILDDTKAL